MASNVRLGIILGLLAGAVLSTGGLALRLVESASGWQILFYRALAFSVFMICVLGIRYRGDTWGKVRAIGPEGIGVAVLLGLGAIAYVFAILHTTVANVVVMLSAAPLVTAVLARIMLGERCDRVTWAAMGATVVGVGVMFADGLTAGGVLGLLIAMLAVLAYALMLVVLRRVPDRDMLPATALSGPVTLVVAAFMAGGYAISIHDMLIGAFLGIAQFGLGFVLITLAARYVAAAQVALLTLSEVVLAPVWVWLAFNEAPTALGWVGGVTVLLSVVGQAVWVLGQARR